MTVTISYGFDSDHRDIRTTTSDHQDYHDALNISYGSSFKQQDAINVTDGSGFEHHDPVNNSYGFGFEHHDRYGNVNDWTYLIVQPKCSVMVIFTHLFP